MINWKIEKRNIDILKDYSKNPRKFTEKGLEDLKKSLENCGDANIITINRDNTVLGGHARLQVMKQLGYKEVDVKVPDRLLTDDECKQIVIRLNANTAGIWDMDKLKLNFDMPELNNWGLDLNFSMEVPDFDTILENENKYITETNNKNEIETFNNLPEELQNTELEPDELAKIENDYQTAKERVIIVYSRDNLPIIEKFLGIDMQQNKVIFDEKELKNGKLLLESEME